MSAPLATVAQLVDYLSGIASLREQLRCDGCGEQRYVCGCGQLIHAGEMRPGGCVFCRGLGNRPALPDTATTEYELMEEVSSFKFPVSSKEQRETCNGSKGGR